MNKNSYKISDDISDCTCAYIAGLLDGEGSITISRSDDISKGYSYCRFRMGVTISNSYMPVLNEIHNALGGYFGLQKEANTDGRGVHSNKDMYEWNVRDSEAMMFLLDFKKYIRVRLKQAELAIKFQELKNRRRGFSNSSNYTVYTPYWAEMKKLNHAINNEEYASVITCARKDGSLDNFVGVD